MDTFFEQIIAVRKTGKTVAALVGIWLAAFLLCFLLFMFSGYLGAFSFLLVAGALYGAFKLSCLLNIEYEYIVTNGTMDIDKIIGKRKRKRMITLDLSAAEAFAPYPSEEDIKADATVFASSGGEKDAYYLVTTHSSYGKVKVIFNPNEKIREAIMKELPNALQIRIKHNLG